MQSKSKSLSYIQYASASLINAKHLLGYHKNVKSLQSSSNQQQQQLKQQQQQSSSATKTQKLSNNNNNKIINNNKLNIYQNRKVAQMSTKAALVAGDTHNNSNGYQFNSLANNLQNNSALVSLKSSKLQTENGYLLPNRMLSSTAFTTTTSTTGISSTNLNGPQQTWSYHVLPSLYSIYQKVSFHLLAFSYWFSERLLYRRTAICDNIEFQCY